MEQLVDVLYEDDSLIVINKPGGILTQAPPGIDSLETRIREYVRWKRRETGEVYVGVPHRLDRPVSGTMVFALRRKVARRLSKQFERREVKKVYWALLAGSVEPPSGTLKDYIRKVPGRALAQIVAEDHSDGKLAVLHFLVKRLASETTWVEVRLETGRMHQIRLQWSSRGHAVLGDDTYGSMTTFGPEFTDARNRQIALHSVRLAFTHPETRNPVEFLAPVPDAWRCRDFGLGDSFSDDECV